MKRLLVVVLCVLMALAVAGCGSAPAEETTGGDSTTVTDTNDDETVEIADTSAGDDAIVIGMSFGSMDSGFFQGESAKAKEIAEANGVEVIEVVAESDINKQASQIDDLISRGVDAIFCVAQDTEAIVSSVDACKEAGIPFVAVGRIPAELDNVSCSIVCDNYEASGVCAQNIATRAEEAGLDEVNVIELVGSYEDQNAIERSEGFTSAAEEYGLNVVTQLATEWNTETCYTRLNDALLAYDDIDAIYIPSDFLLQSVLQVLEINDMLYPSGEEGHVILASIDGDPAGVAELITGYLDVTVNTDAFEFGRLGMETAIALAKGETVETTVQVESVGITADNYEELGDSIWGNAYREE